MSDWKKWAGAAAGAALGDIPGAIAGFTAGDYADKQERNTEKLANWHDPDWRDSEMERRTQARFQSERDRIDSNLDFKFIDDNYREVLHYANNLYYNGHNMVHASEDMNSNQKRDALKLISKYLYSSKRYWLGKLFEEEQETGDIYRVLLDYGDDRLKYYVSLIKNEIQLVKWYESEFKKIEYGVNNNNHYSNYDEYSGPVQDQHSWSENWSEKMAGFFRDSDEKKSKQAKAEADYEQRARAELDKIRNAKK